MWLKLTTRRKPPAAYTIQVLTFQPKWGIRYLFLSEWMDGLPLIQSKLIDTDANVVDASLTFRHGFRAKFSSEISMIPCSSITRSSGKHHSAGPEGLLEQMDLFPTLCGRLKAIQLGDLRVEEPLVLFSLDPRVSRHKPILLRLTRW